MSNIVSFLYQEIDVVFSDRQHGTMELKVAVLVSFIVVVHQVGGAPQSPLYLAALTDRAVTESETTTLSGRRGI